MTTKIKIGCMNGMPCGRDHLGRIAYWTVRQDDDRYRVYAAMGGIFNAVATMDEARKAIESDAIARLDAIIC